MTAGIPGTGIGGFFYLLCVFIMILVEIALTIKSKSSKQRWLIVIPQIGIATGMIIAAWVTDFLVKYVIFIHTFKTLGGLQSFETINQIKISNKIFGLDPIWIPIIILLGVLTFVQFLKLIVEQEDRHV